MIGTPAIYEFQKNRENRRTNMDGLTFVRNKSRYRKKKKTER